MYNKIIILRLKSLDGVSYLVFFDAKYNFKLACLFLDELKTGFEEVSPLSYSQRKLKVSLVLQVLI